MLAPLWSRPNRYAVLVEQPQLRLFVLYPYYKKVGETIKHTPLCPRLRLSILGVVIFRYVGKAYSLFLATSSNGTHERALVRTSMCLSKVVANSFRWEASDSSSATVNSMCAHSFSSLYLPSSSRTFRHFNPICFRTSGVACCW